MRAFLVIDLQPSFGNQSDLLQRVEDIRIEDFVAVRPIEPLDEGVLRRRTAGNEAQGDASRRTPLGKRLGAEFGPVIESNGRRHATDLDELFHDADDPPRR